MISSNLKYHFPTLKMLASMNKKVRKAVLKHKIHDDTFYKALRELAKNTVKRHVPLNKNHKKKLKREKKLILALNQKGNKRFKRRKLVLQSGHGLFLPVVVPIVASLVGELISRYNKNE